MSLPNTRWLAYITKHAVHFIEYQPIILLALSCYIISFLFFPNELIIEGFTVWMTWREGFVCDNKDTKKCASEQLEYLKNKDKFNIWIYKFLGCSNTVSLICLIFTVSFILFYFSIWAYIPEFLFLQHLMIHL